MQKQSFLQSSSVKTTMKLGLIFILILLLLIPQAMIMDLVGERQNLSQSVKNEVAESWGKDQTLTGPVLVIPYLRIEKDDNGKRISSQNQTFMLLPETLEIQGDLTTQEKTRSMYDVLLYNTKLTFSGKFIIPDLNNLGLHDVEWYLEDAFVVTGISDMKGISNHVNMEWNGDTVPLRPGTNGISFRNDMTQLPEMSRYEYPEGQNIKSLSGGLQSQVALISDVNTYLFNFNIDLNGSQNLMFLPLGKENNVFIKSSFSDPSFQGAFLPTHTTNNKGFEANWSVFEYNRSIPPYYTSAQVIDASNSAFGIKIDFIIDHYTKSSRTAKYMFLIIALTFLVVFLTEMMRKSAIHIFQYTLIGLAIAIFFILLLSMSEFIGFDKAYIIASIATTGLVYLYSLGLFNHKKSSHLLLMLLVLLFGYVYTIIQLEKTALLVGSIGLFIIVAATMYATRRIQWFEEGDPED